MESLYKHILLYRVVEIIALEYSINQSGPVVDIVRIIREYNI